uniref:YqjK family protein n=1 Tax=uncultured Halomonas sp. TaxID=173971 RepID=UPI00261FD335|nr:YqjK family protein [uncultured Halomonas sp.]
MAAKHGAYASRSDEKTALEERIEQQRVDILVEASRWQTATQPLDGGWHRLMRFKTPLYALGGLLVLRLSKHRGRLLRYGRRATTGALAINRMRRLLR